MPSSLRVAAVGDLHCRTPSGDDLRHLFAQAAHSADMLLLCGDLTDFGQPEEAHAVVAALKPVADLPVLAVLGNHDFEGGKPGEISHILARAGVRVLDGDGFEHEGVGFAGAKGYMGGFRARQLQAWGEEPTKLWVREAMNEALKLERALARLSSPVKIVLLHYAPIPDTVAGEPPEIHPFLGSSRLEEPVNRFGATAVFHGHAHYGTPEGRTSAGVPVYNVALPLIRRLAPGGAPFRVVSFERPDGI